MKNDFPMRVSVICGGPVPLYYDLLDKKLNSLIKASECYLFYMLCGCVEGMKSAEKSLGEIWAENNGAPIIYITEKTVDKLMHTLFLRADYIIFIFNENDQNWKNRFVKEMFMKYKMMGKHGSVIRV